jgi:hypothetical protein
MREDGVSCVIIKDLDFVFEKPHRGAKMKVVGVFVSKFTVLKFCPLAPIGSSGCIQVTKEKFCNLP